MKIKETQVIVVANRKGGVGKTTFAVGLIDALAMKGYNVLAIDLDSQYNLSNIYGYRKMVDEKKIKRARTFFEILCKNYANDIEDDGYFTLKDATVSIPVEYMKCNTNVKYADDVDKELVEKVFKDNDGSKLVGKIDLIPSSTSNGQMLNDKLEKFTGRGKELFLERFLQEEVYPLNEYDFVVIDTAPAEDNVLWLGLGAGALSGKNHILIPTYLDALALDGVEKIFSIVKVANEERTLVNKEAKQTIKYQLNCVIDGVVINGLDTMPVAKNTNIMLLDRLNQICQKNGSSVFEHCVRKDATGTLVKSRNENKSFYITKIMPVNVTESGIHSNEIPCLTSDINATRNWNFIRDEKNARKFKKVDIVGMVKFATDMDAVCDEFLKKIGVE